MTHGGLPVQVDDDLRELCDVGVAGVAELCPGSGSGSTAGADAGPVVRVHRVFFSQRNLG
jgi:hypothetical protein